MVKAFVTQPDNLSSVPGAQEKKEPTPQDCHLAPYEHPPNTHNNNNGI